MTLSPKLSICVPSRNRQYAFKKTIESLISNLRLDVQFVFADNSDDPSVMNEYMAEIVKDPRVIYLPSTGETLSMVGNWERAIAATTGQWVTFIGDDDFVDPNVASFITRLEGEYGKIDAVSWQVLHFLWPEIVERDMNTLTVAFDTRVARMPKAIAMSRIFGWRESMAVPTSGFSIYHSAISRHLLEQIKSRFGGTYFEHAVVDYDSAYKVIALGETFYTSQRPFGVMGVCKESNSHSIGRLEDTKKKMQEFISEAGGKIDKDDFPFETLHGVTACIGQVQNWFMTKYNVKGYPDWEKHFIRACQINVEAYSDPEAFEIVAEGYRTAIRAWKGGKYLKHFNPKRGDLSKAIVLSGATEDRLYMNYNIANVKTPGEFYNLANDITLPIDQIDIRPESILIFDKAKKNGKKAA